jgi:hypothetical protein
MTAPFWAAEHWCQEESGKVRHSFELVLLLFALLMLPAVLIQDSGLHSPWGLLAGFLNAIVWVAFGVELALILHHAHDKRAALRAHWMDVLVFVVIFPPWALLFAALGPGWLRGWRLARLWVIAARVFRAEGLLTHRRNLPYIAALTLLLGSSRPSRSTAASRSSATAPSSSCPSPRSQPPSPEYRSFAKRGRRLLRPLSHPTARAYLRRGRASVAAPFSGARPLTT